MKNIFFTLAIIFLTFNSFSQHFNNQHIPWYSGKNGFDGHTGSSLSYDASLKRFKFTHYNPAAQNWFGFSSIIQGSGTINFVTHQSWTATPPFMRTSDGSFSPQDLEKNFTRMTITYHGRVGIGTTEPAQRLHVSGGNIRIDNPISGGQGTDSRIIFGDNNFYLSGQNNPNYQGFELSNKLRIGTNFTDYNSNGFDLLIPGTAMIKELSIQNKLFVGSKNPIGASMGNFTMVVDGKLGAREIEVKTGSWADYVFDNNYNLKSLHEVENYIKQNKHLPNVPSEKEVIENGFSISEMAKIQMEKIEELTLYIIQQQKLIEEMNFKIKQLENTIK